MSTSPQTVLETICSEIRDNISGGGGGSATSAKQDDQTAVLNTIATNTGNIKIDADTINLNTDTLETLIGTTNTNTSAISGKLPSTLGAKTISTSMAVNIASDQVLPVSYTDTAPATANITTADLVSSSASGANSQSIITGSPTANSSATFALSGQESVNVQVSGTWTGTILAVVSLDGGTTWYIRGVHQTGTAYVSSTFTANFSGNLNVAGFTNFRLRATAAITGTAVVKVVETTNPSSIYIANSIKLVDSTTPTQGLAIDSSGRVSVKSTPVTGAINSAGTDLTPKFAFANVAASSTDSSIVALVNAKKLRVVALICLTGTTATSITFNSKGGGAGTAISCAFQNGINGGIALAFNPAGYFETNSGEALTVTTGTGSTTGVQVVYIEV